jgi:RNA polymerase sigma-54 factor
MANFMEILELPLSRVLDCIVAEVTDNPVLEVCSMDVWEQSDEQMSDVKVELTEGHDVKVIMPDDGLSMLRLDQRYEEMHQDSTKEARIREYIGRKIKQTQLLRESIEKRRQNLEVIARMIFRHQRAFLEKGPEYIEPLNVQDLAEETGLSVGIVTRVLRFKHAQTPHGACVLEDFVVKLPRPSEN